MGGCGNAKRELGGVGGGSTGRHERGCDAAPDGDARGGTERGGGASARGGDQGAAKGGARQRRGSDSAVAAGRREGGVAVRGRVPGSGQYPRWVPSGWDGDLRDGAG